MEKPLPYVPPILLNANEMAYDPVKYIRIEQLIKDINRYPDAESTTLREAIANHVGVDPSCMICGTGSDEMLKLILEGYTEQGDVVLSPTPSFSEYDRLVHMVKAKMVKVPCKANFEVDVAALIDTQQQTQAKVILLANPNNPTGIRLSNTDIARLHDATDALIVVDEAYIEFADASALELLKTKTRIVITRTLSKAFGMASLRIGYLMACMPIIRKLAPLKMTYNISGISEAIAIELLSRPEYVKTYVQEIIALRAYAFNALTQIKSIQVIPSEANFLLFQLRRPTDYAPLMAAYKAQHIVIRVLDSGKFIRVTLTNASEFNRFLEVTKEVLQ